MPSGYIPLRPNTLNEDSKGDDNNPLYQDVGPSETVCSWERTSEAVNGNLLPSVSEWQQTAERAFQLTEQEKKKEKSLCHSCKERESVKFSHFLPFSRTIPGRHQDESKLCLTNTLVLFSLHGKLARTSDTVSSDQRQYFFLTPPPFLPPSQARRALLLLACLSHKGRQTTSEYLGFYFTL